MSPIDLARRFHARTPWADVPFDPDSAADSLDFLRRKAFLTTTETGICAGMLVPVLWNKNELIAQEIGWYSETPGEGKELRRKFESWAASQGAKRVGFSILADEREAGMRRMLTRAGYVATEIAMARRV